MNTSPMWFKVVAVVGVLWNLLGCFAFFSDLNISAETLAKLPASQQALYATRPVWAIVATATAVFGGVLGCTGMLLGKKWAVVVLVLSLAGIAAQDFGLFVLADAASIVGKAAVIMQTIVFAIGIGLVLLCRKAQRHGWLK